MVKKVMGEEKGSVMVMVVLALVVLIGFTGLVIDGGSAYLTKSRLQNAADAGALAGVQSLPQGLPNVAKTSITYAGLNGMKPEAALASPLDSDSYIATRDHDTIQVDYIKSTEFSTIEDAYTLEEENNLVNEFTAELNDMSDTELMAEADSYSVPYETTGIRFTYEYLSDQSNSELLTSARANFITDGLTTISLASMTNEQLVQCAGDNGYTNIPNKYIPLGDNKRNEFVSLLRTHLSQKGLDSDQGTIISDKTALINALYNKLNEGVIINLANPSAVRTAILGKYRADLEAQQKVVNHGHPDRVRVTCTRTVQNSFMSVLGFWESTISATAVGEWRTWAGEALPAVNMNSKYSEDPSLQVWGSDNVAPGQKERIHKAVVSVESNNTVIKLQVNLSDNPNVGPYMRMSKGVDASEVKDALEYIVQEGKNVYLLSLKDDLLDPPDNTYAQQVDQGFELPMSDLVLLKCIVEQDWKNSTKTFHLTFVEAYDWNDEKNTFVMGDPPKLVE